jgi:hypothetical protein
MKGMLSMDKEDRERLESIFERLQLLGDSSLLDEIVCDALSNTAANINNGGYEEQVPFILSEFGDKRALEMLEEVINDAERLRTKKAELSN